MKVDMHVLNQALEVMWKGMVSIFAVIIILTIFVYIITKFVKDAPDEEQN